MKKLIIFLLFVSVPLVLWGATPPTSFKLYIPSATYSPVKYMKVSMKVQAVYDSIVITNAGDSLNAGVAVLDTTGVNWTAGATNTWYVSGLTPATSYKWMVRVVKTGTKTYTNSDTLSTKQIDVGKWENGASGQMDMGRRMNRWDSWSAWTSPLSYQAFTMTNANNNAGVNDSTVVYNVWDKQDVTMMCYGDSVHVTALAYAGICESDTFRVALVDSALMTAKGVYHFNTLDLPVCKHWYIKFRSNTPNGKVGHPTTIFAWLNRSRYQAGK